MAHIPGFEPARASRLGILADDMTGAADTALQFFGAGDDVWVVPAPSASVPAAGVLSLNTESRHLPLPRAAAAVHDGARWLLAAGCTRFYKKVDSTARGHLALEVAQALATLGLDLAVVAPAFPQAGRITVGGYQLVDGLPVSASAYARDPFAPATEAHLPTLLAPVGGVAHLGLNDVMGGADRVATAIARAIQGRQRVLVADAARPEDLKAIARGMALTPFRLLPVGSAGLARAMQPHAVLDVAARPAGPLLVGPRPPVLVAAGSLNPVTTAQVGRLPEPVVTLDVEGLLLLGAPVVDRAAGALRALLLARADVVLRTAADPDAGVRAQALGRQLGMGPLQVGERVAAAVGEAVARAVEGLGPADLAGVVVAGGETAAAVCRALGGPPLRVAGAPLPAVPLLAAGGLRLVTKSGGFGAPDALVSLIAHLKRDDPA